MKAKLIPAIVAVAAILPVAGQAATQTGNLTVTTTIQVSCDAPSPSGNLVLPFSSGSSLVTQAQAANPARVTVTCYGNPIVNHVDFSNGQYRVAGLRDENGVRYMLRDGATGTAANDYLGYKLFAIVGTTATTAEISASGTAIYTQGTANDNRLTLGGSNTSFSVGGRIYESSERVGAWGNPTLSTAGSMVTGGTYNDQVVMTIDYN